MSNHRYGLRTASGNIKDILQEDSLQVGRVFRSRTRINQGDVFFSDLFGMPAAGYSLRKLTPNAINCIRVRRSNDNAEQDIGFINSKPNAPINTGQLLQFVGANNGFVTTWYDQSTTGDNFTQSTGNLQPEIITSGSVITLNSLPSITMTATQWWGKTLFTNKLLDIYLVRESTNTLYVKFTGRNDGEGYDYVGQSGGSSISLQEKQVNWYFLTLAKAAVEII
jgi:hypothetical protein